LRAVDLGPLALWTLLPVSVAFGVFSTLVFHWAGNRRATRLAVNQILAHVLEFRLFLDDPVVILQAQWNLLRANLQFLRLLLIPALILSIPSVLIVERLNALYGRAPLRTGEAVVVSTRTAKPLSMPKGIAIETPAIHTNGETAWRIRPFVSIPVQQLTSAGSGLAIPFPPARILGLHWLVWFSLFFSVAAVGAKCVL
jgi:hypothetical protein